MSRHELDLLMIATTVTLETATEVQMNLTHDGAKYRYLVHLIGETATCKKSKGNFHNQLLIWRGNFPNPPIIKSSF